LHHVPSDYPSDTLLFQTNILPPGITSNGLIHRLLGISQNGKVTRQVVRKLRPTPDEISVSLLGAIPSICLSNPLCNFAGARQQQFLGNRLCSQLAPTPFTLGK